MLTRAQKAERISELSDRFARAKATFVVDFNGMDVEQVTNLRKGLRKIDAEMKVVRNTLAKNTMVGNILAGNFMIGNILASNSV